jgi:hypothetical protein
MHGVLEDDGPQQVASDEDGNIDDAVAKGLGVGIV